jgi:hypothetical protein
LTFVGGRVARLAGEVLLLRLLVHLLETAVSDLYIHIWLGTMLADHACHVATRLDRQL